MDRNLGVMGKEIAMAVVFITCMYFGFKYNNGWAFAGAVISFLSIGNNEK